MTVLIVLVVLGALWMLFSAFLFWALCYAGANCGDEISLSDLSDWPPQSFEVFSR